MAKSTSNGVVDASVDPSLARVQRRRRRLTARRGTSVRKMKAITAEESGGGARSSPTKSVDTSAAAVPANDDAIDL
mgnify:FL=1